MSIWKAFAEGVAKFLGEHLREAVGIAIGLGTVVLAWLAGPDAYTLHLTRLQIAGVAVVILLALASTALLTRGIGKRRRFHVTQMTGPRNFWRTTSRGDGSSTTQIGADLIVKNLTDSPLLLLTARLLRPKPQTAPVHAQVCLSNGDACVAPPLEPARMSIHLLYHERLRCEPGDLIASIRIADDEGRAQRVKLRLRQLSLAGDDEAKIKGQGESAPKDAESRPVSVSDLNRLRKIVTHIADTWSTVLAQRQFIQTISDSQPLAGALQNMPAVGLHNVVGVVLVRDLILAVGTVVLDTHRRTASLQQAVSLLLNKKGLLELLQSERSRVEPGPHVDAAAAKNLGPWMAQHMAGVFEGARDELKRMHDELFESATAKAIRAVRHQALAHHAVVHEHGEWRLWRSDTLTYAQLEQFIDVTTVAISKVTRWVLAANHDFRLDAVQAERSADHYARALTTGLTQMKLQGGGIPNAAGATPDATDAGSGAV